MKSIPYFCLITLSLALCMSTTGAQERSGTPFPRFEGQEIDRSLKVGYAVLLADLDGDQEEDIVVVDTTRVIWFENPAWKVRTIIQDRTTPDNVCIAAHDIDRDGQVDLALGAGWRGLNSKAEGTLQWLRRGKSLDEPWTLYPIDTEVSIHRIRFADVNGDGQAELVSGPLLGAGSTRENNWSETPTRLRAYKIPAGPTKQTWHSQVLDDGLHVLHNFWPADLDSSGTIEVLTASYEGIGLVERGLDGQWKGKQMGAGNQDDPRGRRGSSEVRLGSLPNDGKYIAAIEPWHGHQVVAYTPPQRPGGLWTRRVLDEQLRWGHAVWCADLDSDGNEEIVIGVRDALNDETLYGVNVYRATDSNGTRWEKHVIENGGVAVEDLAVGDLNADGRPDIVAAGRATGNVKIYWNRGNE